MLFIFLFFYLFFYFYFRIVAHLDSVRKCVVLLFENGLHKTLCIADDGKSFTGRCLSIFNKVQTNTYKGGKLDSHFRMRKTQRGIATVPLVLLERNKKKPLNILIYSYKIS